MATLAASICIPTLTAKRLPYLAEAIRSAQVQTRDDIEILVRNDGTDTAIGEFVAAEARKDPRIRYAINECRLGLGGNWNAIAQSACGTFLSIIGDDDRLLPDFVERLLASARPETAVLFCNHFVIDETGARDERLTRHFLVHFGRSTLAPGVLRKPALQVWRNSVPMSSALVRTTDVRRLGIKPDLNTPEIELFARLAAEGKQFVFTDEYLAEYRVHSSSATTTGLMGERLIKYLENIPVDDEVTPVKTAFMESLLVGAVSRAFDQGNMAEVQTWLGHRFYPRVGRGPRQATIFRALGRLPIPLAMASFRLLREARRAVRRAAQI